MKELNKHKFNWIKLNKKQKLIMVVKHEIHILNGEQDLDKHNEAKTSPNKKVSNKRHPILPFLNWAGQVVAVYFGKAVVQLFHTWLLLTWLFLTWPFLWGPQPYSVIFPISLWNWVHHMVGTLHHQGQKYRHKDYLQTSDVCPLIWWSDTEDKIRYGVKVSILFHIT